MQANAQIKIVNDTSVALEIIKLDHIMDIVERGNLKGIYEHPVTINPKSTTFIILPIAINTDHIGKRFLRLT